MEVLYIVVPIALLMGGGAVAWFIWGVRHGQLDDLKTPAERMLWDDTPAARDPQQTPGSTISEAKRNPPGA